MKKILAIAIAATCVTSFGASFSWSTTTKTVFGGETVGGVSALLVYIGATDTLTGSDIAITKDSTASSIASSIGTATDSTATSVASGKTMGKLSGTYEFTSGVNDGDYFAVLMSYSSGDKTYFNISSTFQGSFDSASNTWSPATTTATWTTASDAATSISAGGGWTAVAVPEPSTAALALAGLALLLKRRKA